MEAQSNLATRALFSGKVIASCLIIFFFVVIIMVATAQQDVLTRLKAEGLNVGYSSALTLREEAQGKTEKLPVIRRAVSKASADVDAAQSDVEEKQNDFDVAWDAFQPDVVRLKQASICDLVEAGNQTPGERSALANDVKRCQPAPETRSGITRMLAAAQANADRFMAVAGPYLRATEALNRQKRKLAFYQAQETENATLSDEQQKAQRSFGDIAVLLQPWLVFGHYLVAFPPPLLQILLTFVSGLFGALLLTLILIVYPNNEVTDPSKSRSTARTVLGGCIALCVYVVILSGTAVLGSGNGETGAGTNYMAFCGLGVLAGMFSDRVAGWLSNQADAFFKR